MTTINKVLMVGRVVRAPEVVERNNFKFTKLTIVTEYTPKSRGGEEKKEVCYLDCTVWNQEAELAAKYLSSGSVIAIEGRLKLEKWMDKATNLERSKHVLVADTVTFLEKIKVDAPQEEVQQPVRQFTKSAPATSYAPKPIQKSLEEVTSNPGLYDEMPF